MYISPFQISRKKTPIKIWCGSSSEGVYIRQKAVCQNYIFPKSIWSAFKWSNPFPKWIKDSSRQYKYIAKNHISNLENLGFYATSKYVKIGPEIVSSASSQDF